MAQGEWAGAREGFTGPIETLDGYDYEVDAGGNWWLTEDRFHRRLRRRPNRPTFPAGWQPGDARLVPDIDEGDYEEPVAYNAFAADGTRLAVGMRVRFLDRGSDERSEGTVEGMPGAVLVRDAAGRVHEASWDDIEGEVR